jgi:hypothetical protein
MKKIVVSLLLLISFPCLAQEKGPSIGFQLNEFQNDFGLGLNYTSPYFANELLAIRLRGNLMFYEYYSVENNQTKWSPYSNLTLGIVSGHQKLNDVIACYGEGGVIGILPSTDFSEDNINIGGYGLFGFEFYFAPQFNYFIELGGVGTSASADKLAAKPIYSNGFVATVGFRINFINTNQQ